VGVDEGPQGEEVKSMAGALKVLGAVFMLFGLLMTVFAGWQIANVAPAQGGARITAAVAVDTTCGYGGITAVDCWASNESLSLNAAALTGTIKLDVIRTSGGTLGINPDDAAWTFTLKNDGPPIYDTYGNEIPQPVYMQVTSVDCIVSDAGVCIPIVNVDTINRLKIGMRDFADNNFQTQMNQGLLGTLLAGASDSAKLDIQLRVAAFDVATLAVGQSWHIRGTVGNQAFDWTVYANTVI